MKSSFILYITLIFSIAPHLFSQTILKPSQTHALLHLKFINPDETPVKSLEISVVQLKSKAIFKAKTNENGLVQVLVPKGESYTTSCGSNQNTAPISIPDRAYLQWKGTRYTHPTLKLVFEYKDLSGKTVKGEQIRIDTRSGLTFVGETNQFGLTTIYLPGQDAYSISSSTQEHFHDFDYPIPLNGMTTIKYYHVAKSSVQLEQENLQLIQAQKTAEAGYIKEYEERRIRDSIQGATPTVVIFINRYGKPIDIYDGGKAEILIGRVTDYFYSICRNRPNEDTAEVLVKKLRGTYQYCARSEDQEWTGSYTLYGGGVHYISVGLEKGKPIKM
jgi:hypothetical protein